jgi:hypothetical protein
MSKQLKLLPWLLMLLLSARAVASDERVWLLSDRSPEHRAALLIVGTAHFANPGRDLVNPKVPDVLTPQRQAQIRAVAKALIAFHPTYVAVEWPRSRQRALDARYRDYRAGHYALRADEAEQLGLRVAASLGLSGVQAVDWNESPPGDPKSYDWYDYALSHGEKPIVEALSDPHLLPPMSLTPSQTVGQWLLALNRPEALAAGHRVYFDIARIGDREVQQGANWVGSWYAHNLRIFDNIVSFATKPSDRVLVVYGAGHAYLLRQFARESGAFRVVDVADVLGALR